MALIHIGIEHDAENVGWSIGQCPRCQDWSPVKVYDVFHEVTIWFVPVTRDRAGQSSRCNFCGKNHCDFDTDCVVPLDAWEPAQGFASLKELCGIQFALKEDWQNSEQRLAGLLEAASRASGLMSAGTFGLGFLGAVLGLFCGFALGFCLQALPWLGAFDAIETGVACALIGLPVGLLLGVFRGWYVVAERLARARLRAAWRKYQIDLHRLELAARGSPGRVRRAIVNLMNEACSEAAAI
jgi:hypothetical protein